MDQKTPGMSLRREGGINLIVLFEKEGESGGEGRGGRQGGNLLDCGCGDECRGKVMTKWEWKDRREFERERERKKKNLGVVSFPFSGWAEEGGGHGMAWVVWLSFFSECESETLREYNNGNGGYPVSGIRYPNSSSSLSFLGERGGESSRVQRCSQQSQPSIFSNESNKWADSKAGTVGPRLLLCCSPHLKIQSFPLRVCKWSSSSWYTQKHT